MPNRMLRDWTESDKVDQIDIPTERFFTRLIMKVDDYGRYSANPKLLKSTLFPLKSDIRETDVARWLTECEKSGLVVLYHVAEKGYLQINDFRQKLRQKNEKYPPPPKCIDNDPHVTVACIADVPPEEKRIEVEEEEEGKGSISHPLEKSNLFRKPTIPTIQQVEEKFLMSGGSKEMAGKFFDKHSAVDWYLNNSPITNFSNLVPGFITNWNKNQKNDGVVVVNKPGQLSSVVRRIEEEERLKKSS